MDGVGQQEVGGRTGLRPGVVGGGEGGTKCTVVFILDSRDTKVFSG